MQVDWLTVIAQIVNFLILVWLLKRFLYKPVINAMDSRQQRIAEALNSAREREQAAEQNAEHYREQQQALERERGELLAEARSAADSERERLLAEARQAVAQQRERWQKQLAEEQADFLKRVSTQLADSACTVSRRVLADLADTDLEKACVRTFIRRLANLSEEERRPFSETTTPLQVRTAFALDAALESAIKKALDRHLHPQTTIEFKQAPALICGIAVDGGDHQLDWTIDDYLAGLEESLAAGLEVQ